MISSYPGAMAEISLAMAQAHMSQVIREVGEVEIARQIGCPLSHLNKLLEGDHDLTVREFAMVMEAAGFELCFDRKPNPKAFLRKKQYA
jgi:DNA-binding phage protein